MTVINLTRDDLGVQRLREANTARAAAPLSSLTATSMVGPHLSPAHSIPRTAPEERRRGERRRQRPRRNQARPAILLDTRAHHERRIHERRHHAADHGRQYQPLGIDIHI